MRPRQASCWPKQGRRDRSNIRSTCGGPKRERDDRARRRPDDGAADLHRRAARRRLRRTVRARAGRASSTRCWRPDDEPDRRLPVAAPGSTRTPMPAALVAAVRQAAAGGAAMLFTPEMSGLLDRDRERGGGALVEPRRRMPVLAAVREAAARARAVGPSRLARGASGEAASSPTAAFVIDPDGRDPRALRQDPSVRRRPADRRKLARIGGLRGRATGRWWSTGRRSARSA